jgi:serine protease inhibitor
MNFKFTFKDDFSTITDSNIEDFTKQAQSVKMMNGITTGTYLKSPDVEGCVIDLDNDYKMVLLNVSENIKKAEDINLNTLLINGYEQNLSVSVPVMNISYTNTNNQLLTNIQQNIMTSGVGYNKLFEGVASEVGIESVNTAMHIELNSNSGKTPLNVKADKELKFDKPFYFLIVNNKTNNIIVVGHYGFMK